MDSLKSGRRSNSSLTRTNSAKSLTAKLDSHIKNIENERDFFKQEVDTLQKLLKSAQHEYQLRSYSSNRLNGHRSVSPGHAANGRRSVSNHKSRKDQVNGSALNGSKRTKSTSPGVSQTRCSVCAERLSTANRVSPCSTVNKRMPSTSPSRANEEINKLRRERDELQTLLDKFERHMAEVCVY